MMLKHMFAKLNFKGFMVDNVQAIEALSELFMVLGTRMLGWLIKSAHVYSMGLSCLISTPNYSSD
jgi:hypothetical protein